jgi:phospholipid/cholesterol/gamma-HCH transport system permease protein
MSASADTADPSLPRLTGTLAGGRLQLVASGPWIATYAETLERQVNAISGDIAKARSTTVDLAGVDELDTLGAWLLERTVRHAGDAGRRVGWQAVRSSC